MPGGPRDFGKRKSAAKFTPDAALSADLLVTGTANADLRRMQRQFIDPQGRTWQVWEVIPTFAERRVLQKVVARERRVSNRPRASLPVEMREGWLAFQSANERRRMAPTPLGWELLSDRELVELLQQAVPIGRVRRLIE